MFALIAAFHSQTLVETVRNINHWWIFSISCTELFQREENHYLIPYFPQHDMEIIIICSNFVLILNHCDKLICNLFVNYLTNDDKYICHFLYYHYLWERHKERLFKPFFVIVYLLLFIFWTSLYYSSLGEKFLSCLIIYNYLWSALNHCTES